MRIQILQSAFDDLDASAEFYERQEPGVGGYFMGSLLADIDPLVL